MSFFFKTEQGSVAILGARTSGSAPVDPGAHSVAAKTAAESTSTKGTSSPAATRRRMGRHGTITKLKTQAIYVADQEKALAFYRDALGFEVRRDVSMGAMGRWIEVAPQGAESCLVLFPKEAMSDWDKRTPSIVFACTDTFATCAELTKRGVKLVKEPQKMGWGNFASFLDPDGNELGLTDQK